MIYISPIQEEVIAGGFTSQVRRWHAAASHAKKASAAAMEADLKEVQNTWIPGLKFDDAGTPSARKDGPDLSKGFRRKWRFVIAYNGNKEIAVYAKFEVNVDKLKLVYITSATEGGVRVDCGEGAKPVPATLAFLAQAGKTLNLPVYLNADGPNADKLVDTYKKSGWELTGVRDGSGPEMVLTIENLDRPLATHNPQRERVHWIYGGEGTLASYLTNPLG